jgi:hypothetical protein
MESEVELQKWRPWLCWALPKAQQNVRADRLLKPLFGNDSKIKQQYSLGLSTKIVRKRKIP